MRNDEFRMTNDENDVGVTRIYFVIRHSSFDIFQIL